MSTNKEADYCEGVKIEPVVLINPHLHHGVPHKVDFGVDKIPLIESVTFVLPGSSYHYLSVESISCFPIVFLERN